VAVSIEDVRHVAALARIGLSAERASAMTAELNAILEHMAALERVDTAGLEPAEGIGAAGTPLRPDHGPPIPLARGIDAFAPESRDGFFLVPRLATHENAPEESA
jgi:aspartyl-tRNA(Asn)/glutamyl-tRNA(Gln) amidotransferase subunit C